MKVSENSTCKKVFGKYFGWIRANTLTFDRDNHLKVKKLFKEVRVLTGIIMGGDK